MVPTTRARRFAFARSAATSSKFCSTEWDGASGVSQAPRFLWPGLVRFCRQAWRCRQNRAFGGAGYTFVPANVFAGATFSSVQDDRAHFLVRKRPCRAHKSANFGPGGGVRGPKSVHGPLRPAEKWPQRRLLQPEKCARPLLRISRVPYPAILRPATPADLLDFASLQQSRKSALYRNFRDVWAS